MEISHNRAPMAKRRSWSQEEFGMRLRGLLYLRQVTQRELAHALRVNPGTISRWKKSKANYPGLDHLLAAAQFLKVDPGWLAFGEQGKPEIDKLRGKPKISRVTTRMISESRP